MNIRDGWAAEYSRKSFSVQVDEQDYRKWLEEAGVHPDNLDKPPLRVKFRIMRLIAATWTLGDLADYYKRQGEAELFDQTMAELKEAQAELGEWQGGVKENFG